jgi:hypothetical protein
MTVAPGVLASTAANTRTEAGRSSAAAVLRATTMSREIYCGKILPRDLQVRRRVGRSQRGAVAEGSARPYGACEYPRREPRGPIVEKRRLHLASCDEALFIITTSPFDSPTASARPLPSSCRAATRGTYATLANPRPTWASFARAVRCYRLYGDISLKIAPDRTLFSAQARGGQRGHEKSICDRELDIARYA